MNLVSKLIEKTKKTALISTLAVTMAANTAMFVGCKPEVEEPAEQPKNEVVEPTQNPENLDPVNPQNPTEQDPVVEEFTSESLLTKIDLNQYSPTLQKVLTDEYYMNLRDSSLVTDEISENQVKAIPYGSLKSLGYSNSDVNNILNDTYSAQSFVYIKDNDLYIALNAEQKPGSEKYYGSFLLKYELTEQELYELKMLHFDLSKGASTYREAPLFIQALSQLKTPEVLSSAYITQDALNKTLEEDIDDSSYNYYNTIKFPVFFIFNKAEQVENYPLTEGFKGTSTLFIDSSKSAMSENAKMITITRNDTPTSKYINGNFVVTGKLTYRSRLVSLQNSNTLESQLVPITRLNSEDKGLASIGRSNEDIAYLKSINYSAELNK